jgi:predicted O-linked N-acetylglucosamine transferase (SPINDLY family)
VDGERLIFAQRIPSAADHLRRISLADLFLDTQPYNAEQRLTTPLFDTRRYTEEMQCALAEAFERYHSGAAPDHIGV